MDFKDILQNDAVNILNSDGFAEEITYIPKTGTQRKIYAVINRQRISPSPEDAHRALINQVEIVIANDPINGSSSIDKGNDAFSFPQYLGEGDTEWVVEDIISHDEGAWHLLLGK